MKSTDANFDIVISGGGLSGSLMALSLSDLRDEQNNLLSIAIVEANPVLENPALSFDDRVLALSHGSANYLKQVGAWQYLSEKAQPIETIHISDRGHYGKARMMAKAHGVSALGYVVEMSVLGKSLLDALSKKTNITWFAPTSIEKIDWHQEHVELNLSSQQAISAKLLLGCDGAHSVCRSFANIKSQQVSYQQSALIANVSTNLDHNNVAYERFTEHGPIAMLPLSSSALPTGKLGNNRCSLVWTLPPEQAKEILAVDDERFKNLLEQSFGSWLGAIEHVGKRDIYPLNLVQADEQVFHRMVLIGNASHTIHPIAGQGFNLGLRDVEALSKVIKQALLSGKDFTEFSVLAGYAENRKQDHDTVITFTDSLVTLFSNQLPPLIAGRNVGLKVLNYFTPLKNALINKTMGY